MEDIAPKTLIKNKILKHLKAFKIDEYVHKYSFFCRKNYC